MSIGERVRTLREEQYLSLSGLADLAGIAKSSLHEIESNHNARPSAESLYSIAEVLGTSIGYLLGREPAPAPRPAEVFPESLEVFARKKRIPLEDKRGLARAFYQGKQPLKADDWAFLYEALKRCVG
jgi:transcriptional regulator with XRE-family HTH domain